MHYGGVRYGPSEWCFISDTVENENGFIAGIEAMEITVRRVIKLMSLKIITLWANS